MNLLIFDVFRDFGDILVTSLILGAAMACYWLVNGLLWLVIGLSMACQWLVNGLSMACYWSTMRRGGALCKLEYVSCC